MKARQLHSLHEGELKVQERRQTPRDLSDSMPNYIDRNMPLQHAEFYAGLSYLPMATLDDQGRPWASLLVTRSNSDPSIGITISGHNEMTIVAETNPYDPFVAALEKGKRSSPEDKPLFAGVGVDFTNRRRNKIAGEIESASHSATGKIDLKLVSDQHLGNCPKYITVRTLEHETRDAEVLLDSRDALTSSLPEFSKALIDRASTVFLATRHSSENGGIPNDQSDMGLNHRGGSPGFVRVYEDKIGEEITTYLVLPDHSGNRFYQSLGNIETNSQVGLVFPDFASGDVLYVTGEAENLYDEKAEEIMHRVTLLTRIRVTGAVYVKNGLNLRLVSDEQHSPYNPPVRYLRLELEQMGRAAELQESSADSIGAMLVSTRHLSDSVSTFTFQLSTSIEAPLPGGFGVFDFSEILDSGYSHMDEANPQRVNEDYVRTWTLSSAPDFDPEKLEFSPTDKVSVTVKHKPGGLVSSFLHDNAARTAELQMQLQFKGTGVGFSCFTPDGKGNYPAIPAKMLWVAGGVGITPFMSMWDGMLHLANAGQPITTDIILMFSGRDDDLSLLRYFLASNHILPEHLSIRVLAYQSVSDDPASAQSALDALTAEFPLHVVQRRLEYSDFENVEDLSDREVFLCGPDTMMKMSTGALDALGEGKLKIHQESYVF